MYTGIMLYPRFSEYELSVLLSILKQGKKPIVFIGLDKQEVKGEAGLRCFPDVRIDEVDVSALDSIAFPGADDFRHLVDHPELIAFLRKLHKKRMWIGAISSAPYLLSMSGLLDGKKYTTGLTEEQRHFLGTFSKADFIDKPVVVDDNLITARGSHFIAFAIEYGKSLGLDFDEGWYKH
ncbi:DJ-1/PfpI family protein [Bacillus sp. Marseille-Q3570]|uniref:DJ-1/PfpI family protein n=1 Tax=Bacillus sp. Marseille-Q3570 TaxID=2963522 RepID=UPI0021B76F58|nr:DJ-1/PfpI family protein [Bacillus sp. Marseille-Q3570]